MASVSELPSEIPTHAPAARPRRVTWKRLSLTLTALVALFVWWSWDEAPPDVSDLTFEPLKLSDQDNGYAVLTRAALLIPEQKWTDAEDDTLTAMRKGDAWDQTLAQTCVDRLAPAWPLMMQAAKISEGQAPWITSLDDMIPELAPIKTACDLALIQALFQARHGSPDDGIQTALLVLSLGHLIEKSRGGLIHYLSGTAIKNAAMNTLRTIIVRPKKPSADMLRIAQREVAQSRAGASAQAHAFYAELRTFEAGMKLMNVDSLGSYFPLVLKPNRTKRLFNEYLRNAAQQIDRPLADLNENNVTVDFHKKHIRGWLFYSPNNIRGRTYLSVFTPTTDKLLKSRLRCQSKISAMEAFIACQRYNQARRRLPDTLDDLIPGYLASVPMDYFDGTPIRYSRELGVIWSVGEKDLNITRADQDVDPREIVLHLSPKPKPEVLTEPVPTVRFSIGS